MDITVIGDEGIAPKYPTHPRIVLAHALSIDDWIPREDYLLSCYKLNGFPLMPNLSQTRNCGLLMKLENAALHGRRVNNG